MAHRPKKAVDLPDIRVGMISIAVQAVLYLTGFVIVFLR